MISERRRQHAGAGAGNGWELFIVGLSYKTAPVDVRERVLLSGSRLQCCGCRLKLKENLSEIVLVSTCNRVELYGVGPSGSGRQAASLFRHLSHRDFDFSSYLYVKQGAAAVEHLFAVAGGLDSMVLGETEILGQVKQAYQAAQAAKLTGRVTNRLFQTALQVGKELRTETGIGRGSTSVGSVAVDLAERIFDGDLSGKTLMIIGAGKMGEACARHLAKKGAGSVLVTNRSYERALNLAAAFGGQPVPFDHLLPAMTQADIVVSSTGSPQTILGRQQLQTVMSARPNRPLFLIDIAVPRDIDSEVQELEGVYLYNVDHLEAIVRENVRLREQELAHCRAIITERAGALMARFAPAPEPIPAPPITREPDWLLSGVAVCPS